MGGINVKSKDILIVSLAISGTLLIVAGVIMETIKATRDYYCFTTPYEEVKESKMCEVYFNGK